VTRRFQIEDLIVQDGSGVIFRALDTQSGRQVALRRFFPFGVAGGGLREDERAAYQIAAERLGRLHHPSLRAVVAGGCDPVDGIPFLATEWVEGETLGAVLQDGRLDAVAAAEMLGAALEVSDLLSQVLAEEAVWAETDPRTIIIGSPESGRGFTFWISPVKWLGVDDPSRRLESIIKLTEEVMDWKGRVVSDQSGQGLGAWFNWLRGASATASLREARENLAAAIGAEPPQPARQLLAAARRRQGGMSRPSKIAAGVAASMALAACATGAWWLSQQRPGGEAITPAAAPPGELERVNQRAAAMAAEAASATAELAARIAAQQAAASANDGIIAADSRELLEASRGEIVRVEGVVRSLRTSRSGKTHYLLFAAAGDALPTRAVIPAAAVSRDLQDLAGKKVRVTGTVKSSARSGVEVRLDGTRDIELVD
jgi:hypothetical protein